MRYFKESCQKNMFYQWNKAPIPHLTIYSNKLVFLVPPQPHSIELN